MLSNFGAVFAAYFPFLLKPLGVAQLALPVDRHRHGVVSFFVGAELLGMTSFLQLLHQPKIQYPLPVALPPFWHSLQHLVSLIRIERLPQLPPHSLQAYFHYPTHMTFVHH